MAHIIYTSGKVIEIKGENKNNYFTLKQLQDIIGGYVEEAPLLNEPVFIPTDSGNVEYNCAYFNEDGKVKNLVYNSLASEILGYEVVGEVIFCNEDEDGNLT